MLFTRDPAGTVSASFESVELGLLRLAASQLIELLLAAETRPRDQRRPGPPPPASRRLP
ncbi:hypothetical protein [Cryobacterium breve]|uniref:hypothetical protein n=1 Tax=Cryobacterium breve TaxID=1259258 RepID=UPI00248AF86F|nr:hypothetical protein [Cryobacterium breve]